MFKRIVSFIADRLTERSTRIALGLVAGAFGVAITPDQIELIAAAVTAGIGLVESLTPDDAKARRDQKKAAGMVMETLDATLADYGLPTHSPAAQQLRRKVEQQVNQARKLSPEYQTAFISVADELELRVQKLAADNGLLEEQPKD